MGRNNRKAEFSKVLVGQIEVEIPFHQKTNRQKDLSQIVCIEKFLVVRGRCVVARNRYENHFLFTMVFATMMLVTIVQKRCHQHHCYLEILSAKLHKGAQPSGLLILFKGQMGFE